MTDQELENTRETPKEETPPEGDVSEEEKPAEETPAKSDSEEEQPEEKTEKTPEQIEQDKAYFQAEAQKAKEELAALQSKEREEPAAPDIVAPPPPPQPQPSLSKDDLNTFLQDHPAEGFAAIAEYMAKEVKTALGQYTKEVELEADNREANRILREFCSKNSISKDELQTATDYVKQLGVKGTAAGVSSMVIDRMILNRVLEHGQETVTAAQAKAAAAAKAQSLTAQPDGAGSPPAKKMTGEEVLAGKFKPTKASDFEGQFK